MTTSPRFSSIVATALLLAAISPLHAQVSMMMKNNPNTGIAINRGDFNNDGITDLVVAGVGNRSLGVFLGQGDGTFAAPILTATGHQMNDLAFGDFNNDGNLDVAVTDIDSNSAQVFLGNGDGTFTLAQTITLDAAAVSITAADFNNDGTVDLAVGIGFTTLQGVRTNEVVILSGDGTGSFTAVNTIQLSVPSEVTKVRVADFDNDGNTDIAVLQSGAVTAFFGNGDFTFDPVVLKQYVGTTDMNTGDLNQDSFTDIIVSWRDNLNVLTGGVDVFYGTANRTLTFQQAVITSNTFESPTGLIAADVNGDGINDIATLDAQSGAADGLYVWMGNPDGSFQQTPVRFIYTSDRNKRGLAAGDFNRDGKIDFAALLQSNSTMEVLLNATPRADCQLNLADQSVTVCQPQNDTFSNSPLHIVAQGNSSNGMAAMQVYIDNVLQGDFQSSSIDALFDLANGDHFVVVKGWDNTGANFRSDRHVSIFTGSAGQTCATSSDALSINVCLPNQNDTLSSPVQILANSYSPNQITAIQVYIDDNLVFDDPTSTAVNNTFDMAPGTHFIVVKAWDAFGNQISDSRTITVN